MRIPLDYYQILGVSFDATPEQIQEAFEDRIQQLPKQQYSNFAIASRKKLLQEAHGILQNPKRRQEHDRALLPDSELAVDQPLDAIDSDTSQKGIDIDSDHLAGALILLIEFGEFDTVLDLGLKHLNRPIDLDQMPSEAGPNDDDVALAVAIAHLELGREYWQQGDREEAGQCLKTGLNILREEGKFLDIQAEIEADLSKLRPYRVLDLLALDLDDPNRAEGLSLLQDMLDARGGMEGHGDDRSGLSVNDFLLFMQQLRDHLTVEEQLNLFKAEAMRPSSVASYLGVFVHVAKGVSEYEPQLISQAKALLSSLADRQDLALEQGMCSLLLGQPDAAVHCVERSTDEEAIALISEYSEGAPDIIPGLYLYTTQWLQEEVYPYFRDLNQQTVSLEDYFNDADVQRQLSELEPDLPSVNSNWDSEGVDAKWQKWLEDTTQSDEIASRSQPTSDPVASPARDAAPADRPTDDDWFAAIASEHPESSTELKWSEPPTSPSESSTSATRQPAPKKKAAAVASPTVSVKSTGNAPEKRGSQQSKSSSKKPWVTWAAAALMGIAALWGLIALAKLAQAPSASSESPATAPVGESDESVAPSTPPADTPSPDEGAVNEDGALTEAAAQEIVQVWQKVKADALGESHQLGQLSQILVEPALSRWTYSANIAQDEGKHTKYTLKTLTIKSVKMESETEAVVRASIEEVRDQFVSGTAEPFASLDDAYEVDYQLTSVEGKWKIKEMDVVE